MCIRDSVSVNTMAAGSVITIPFRVCVHPPASVTVTLYVPAGILVRSCVVAPLLHAYVNGAVPPATVRSIDPVDAPLQFASTCVSDNTMAAGSAITILFSVCVHPPASVTVTLYVPAGIPVTSCVVAPLFHAYVNGPVPPVTERSIEPVDAPLQFALTCVSVNTMAD